MSDLKTFTAVPEHKKATDPNPVDVSPVVSNESAFWRTVAITGVALVLLAGCVSAPIKTTSVEAPAEEAASKLDPVADIREWRVARDERLKQPDGWLSLVGFHWLTDGSNRVGSGADNDIVLSHGPEQWGEIILAEGAMTFTAAEGSNSTVDGETVEQIVLKQDLTGEPTIITSGTTQFHVIERGEFALRVKDATAPSRLTFEGINHYPINLGWIVIADFERSDGEQTVPIINVLDQVTDSKVYGTARFEHEGKTHELLALGEEGDESLFIIFADRTNGRETYGAGRFLYTGMPENGKLEINFNKAYNPPCAFNDYSTCPLPPPENRVNVAIRAGELNYEMQ